MIAPVLALLAVSSGELRTALRLEEAQGIAPEDAKVLAKALAGAIETTAGGIAVVDDAIWSNCEDKNRCLEEIRASASAADVVFLQLFGAGTRIRVVAERVAAGETLPLRKIQIDAPNQREEWPHLFRGLAEILFQKTTAPKVELTAPVTPPPPEPRSAVPAYVAFGGAALTTGAAIALRLASNAARDRVANEPLMPDEQQAEIDASKTQGLLSNLLFGTGAVLVTAGVVYLFAD